MKRLRCALPKGSLEKTTFEIFSRAGIRIYKEGERSYFLSSNFEDVEFLLIRPQEIPNYVSDGIFDCGITGFDWILESGVKGIRELADFLYSKSGYRMTKWVIAVPEDSKIKDIKDIKGKRIATELVNFTRKYLKKRGVDAIIEFSWGATEAKPKILCDAIVELTETGKSLRENRLRIIDVILETTPRFIANKESLKDKWKKKKMEHLLLLLKGSMNAKDMVGLKMNVNEKNIKKIIKVLPALKKPTVSPLLLKGWYAIEVVLNEDEVQKLLPKLKELGAEGIIEYPLNKIIY